VVFKTTCVGSIPATLVIVNFLRPTKKSYLVKLFNTPSGSKSSSSKITLRTNNRYATKQVIILDTQSTVNMTKLGYTSTPPQQRTPHYASVSSSPATLPPHIQEVNRYSKTKAVTRVRRQRYSSQSWLSQILRRRSTGTTQTSANTGHWDVRTVSKNLQVLYAKHKDAIRLLTQNTRFRTKTMRYSKVCINDRSVHYAMIFKKNTPRVYGGVESTSMPNLQKSALLLLLKSKHIVSASTQSINTLSLYGSFAYASIRLKSTPASPDVDPTINFNTYVNSITRLLLSSEYSNLTRTTDLQSVLHSIVPDVENSHTAKSAEQRIVLVNTTSENNRLTTYSLPPFDCWALESRFVRPKSVTSRSAVFILAKAPAYRMSPMSEAPISTSQYYGNLYNRHSLPHDTPTSMALRSPLSSLLRKSVISTSVMFLLKPRKSNLQRRALSLVSNKIRTNNLKTLNTVYRNLLYTPSEMSYSLTGAQPPILESESGGPIGSITANRHYLGLGQAINLKTKPIVRRPFKKYQTNWAPAPNKTGFSEDIRLVSKNKKSTWNRLLRTTYKKVNRFAKWKIRKSTFYFIKFRKLNKKRKVVVRSLARTGIVFNKPSKYQSAALLRTRDLIKLDRRLLEGYTSTNQNDYPYTAQLNVSAACRLGIHSLPTNLTHNQVFWLLMLDPFTLKNILFTSNTSTIHRTLALLLSKNVYGSHSVFLTNLVPHNSFRMHFSKKVLNSFANRLFREDIIPYYQNTLIRFIEYCTGRKVLFQFYPFVNQHIDKSYMVRYKRWLPRMNFYERRLGHKFFLEESLHIMHISFILRDPKVIASWLKAIILRISFWKTRSIFRFLKYLFHNYFTYVFEDIRIKGLKIRLKGKISSAGNSRKRTILYRVGRTSHSEVNLRVVKDFSLINTFTGVMGFQVYLFY
jgi:hypothetical protein